MSILLTSIGKMHEDKKTFDKCGRNDLQYLLNYTVL